VAAPAVAVEVPPPKVPVPEFHITPPQITPPKIAPPKITIPQVQTPTQPTVKDNTPPGGGTTTGGGVNVLQGTPASPQTNPSGGTTIGGAPIVDLKTLLPALQQATPPGGGTSKEVIVNIETLQDLLQQSKAQQASPPGGGTKNATQIDPAQIQSVINSLEQNNAGFNSIIKQAATGADPTSTLIKLAHGPTAICIPVAVCWPSCSGTNVCVTDSTGTYCLYQVSCKVNCQGISIGCD